MKHSNITYAILLILISINIIALAIRNKEIKELKEEIKIRTELNIAYDDALHWFYSNNKTEWSKFEDTYEYFNLDSIKHSDWEDFYYY